MALDDGGRYLRVPSWDSGAAESGSSGSPYFGPDGRIVGVHRGGHSECANPDGADWGSRLATDWFGHGAPANRLKDWLDPLDTGERAIDGMPSNYAPTVAGTLHDKALRLADGASAGSLAVDVAHGFLDRDGDALTYTVSSSNESIVTATISASTVTVSPAAAGMATITVTASDGKAEAVSRTFSVTVGTDRSPEPVGALDAMALRVEDGAASVDVSAAFEDDAGDTLTYAVSSSDTSIATVSISGSTVTVTPLSGGVATIAVTATDGSGSATSALQTFEATVANRPPVAATALAALTLRVGEASATVDAAAPFLDPDGDVLRYSASSSDDSVAAASLLWGTLSVTPVRTGNATITLTATDVVGSGGTASQSFDVAVQQPRGPTQITPEATVTAGTSPVTEGTAAEFTVALSSAAPTGGLTVSLTVADASGSDFVAAANEGSKTLSFAAGEDSKTYTVATVADSVDEADGPIRVTVASGTGYTVGTPSSATVTVEDDDDPPASMLTLRVQDNQGAQRNVDAVTMDESAGAVVLNAELDAAAGDGGVSVTLTAGQASTAGAGDYVLPAPFTILAEKKVSTATLEIVDDDVDEENETIVIEATTASGITVEGVTITIRDDDEAGVSVSAGAVSVAPSGTDTYEVVLDSEPTAAVTVRAASDASDKAGVTPASHGFTAADWNQAKTFTVTGVAEGTATITHGATSDDGKYSSGLVIDAVTVTVTALARPRNVTAVPGARGGVPTITVAHDLPLPQGHAAVVQIKPAADAWPARGDGHSLPPGVSEVAGSTGPASHVFEGFAPGGAYDVRAHLFDGQAAVAASSSELRVVAWDVPAPPPIGSVVAGDGQLSMVWGPPPSLGGAGAAVIGYDVEYKTNSAPDRPATPLNDPTAGWVDIGHSSATTRVAVIRGLTNGVTYIVRVRAHNGIEPGSDWTSAAGTPTNGDDDDDTGGPPTGGPPPDGDDEDDDGEGDPPPSGGGGPPPGGGGGPPPSDDDDDDDDDGGGGGPPPDGGGPPRAAITTDADCDQTLCRALTGERVSFEDTGSGTVRSRLWDFGDGGSSRSRTTTQVWSEPGFYTVTLRLSDGEVESTASLTFLFEAAAPAGTCVPDDETRCLRDSRFAVEMEWWTGDGRSGPGKVVREGTNDSALFRFFDEDNWEVLIKILDGCELNGHVWVFGASTTNLGYAIRVTDTVTGEEKEYRNESGLPAPAMTDATAFRACAP